MAKKKLKPLKVSGTSKDIYEFIAEHPGCSVPGIAAKFPNSNPRSIWSMVSALKKKGLVNNKFQGQWEVVDPKKVMRSSTTKDIKVAKLVIEIDISLKV